MDTHERDPPPSPPPSPHPFAALRSMESYESSSSDEEERPVLPQKTPHAEAIFKRYQKKGPQGSVIREEDAEEDREDREEQEQGFIGRFRMKNLDTGQEEQIASEQQEMAASRRLSIGREDITTDGQGSWQQFWTNVYRNNDQLKGYCEEGLYDQVLLLLSHGQNGYPVEVDCRGLDDWTPLHFACYHGHADVVALLCKQGAAVNAVTRYNRNGLHLAALRGHYEVARSLADCGILLDAYDSDGNTALHFAAENGHREVIVFLLERGCVVSKNREGATPITDCCQDYLKKVFYEHGFREDGDYHQHGAPLPSSNRLHRQIIDSQGLSPQSFEYLRVLGRGSFGEVFLVRRRGEEGLLAMKVLQKARLATHNLRRYAMTERNVMSALDHPFMVRLAYAFQSPSRLFLVMDYYPGGDLGKAITRRKCFGEEEARLYVCEVILALQALHKNMIVFRDLKPDNVVLDAEGHCRLADFGLSKEGIYNNITESFCGSIAYLAPEVLSKQGHSRTVDWYLLGVLMYELIVGIPPYYNTKKEVLFDNIKRGPLKLPKALSFEAKDLIKRLLCRDPKKRLGAIKDSEEIKEHPYFKDVNWEEVLARRVPMPSPEESPELGPNESIKVTFQEQASHGKVEGWTFIQQKH